MALSGGILDHAISLPLESVLNTDELKSRPSRLPDHASENLALSTLAQALADSPQTILQTLADTILDALRVGSAGVSLVNADETRFVWPAVAGAWKHHIGGGTPREFGPCGDVLDRNSPLMYCHLERRYTYLQGVEPALEEVILAPFYVQGRAVGTVWAVAHDPARKFDAEDMRQLVSLARFASSAYQVTESLARLKEVNVNAEAANRAKDKFLAVLSHELRTPLTPVLLTVTAREMDSDLSPALRDDFKTIRQNVELEVKLIDDLLDISRITSGKLRLQFDIVDLNELMRHVSEMVSHHMLERGVQLRCEIPDKPLLALGDPARLQQVFWNLLNNATKFTPERGHIVVKVQAIDDLHARIVVKDSGMGIPPEILPNIFNAFEQGEARITRQFGGMGLGLAICKALVEQHKGAISAETAGSNCGSTFTVELPILSPEDTVKIPVSARPDLHTAARPLRLLVVEDHIDTARVLRKLLTASGHDVRTAHTVAEALNLAGQHPFDLVLSDLGLPDATGYELMKQVKHQYGLKGIAMSGYGMEEDIRRSEQAGFSDHLIKPVNVDQLDQIIRRIVADRVN